MATRSFSRWRKRWLPSLPLATAVFCFWLLMNDAVTAGHVVMGLALALLIPPFAARLDREFARIGSLRGVPRMAGVLLLDILRSNITVALQVLGPEDEITPGFVWASASLPISPAVSLVLGRCTEMKSARPRSSSRVSSSMPSCAARACET